MKRIGLLSDTHNCWDDRYEKYFKDCDEIWHAGDIGSYGIAQRLNEIAFLRAVSGNCDGADIRRVYGEIYRFKMEDAEICMKHIGGTPGHYDSSIRLQLSMSTPNLFVCGHSHILKVQYDTTLGMLYMNPGAAGLQGWQKVRTLVRFTIDGSKFRDLDVIELENDGKHAHILDV